METRTQVAMIGRRPVQIFEAAPSDRIVTVQADAGNRGTIFVGPVEDVSTDCKSEHCGYPLARGASRKYELDGREGGLWAVGTDAGQIVTVEIAGQES